MKIVSFYTQGTGYEKEAESLIASCKKQRLAYDVIGTASKGSWEKNCAYKPQFLIEMLKKHSCPLVWLDADAVILKSPKLFASLDCDLALYSPCHLPLEHPSKFLTGTLYIQNTPAARQLLKQWDKECQKGGMWDQIALKNVLLRGNLELKTASLPESYCAIYDKPLKEEPVIIHYQASRLLKKEVDNEVVSFSKHGLSSL